jgi:hypothetical protein
VDIKRHPDWHRLQNRTDVRIRWRFLQMRAEDIGALVPTFNFSVTVTAMEHLQDDAHFAQGLFQVMLPSAYSIHIVPGPWSFFLYGWRSWRRYSAARLVSLFEQAGFEIVETYALGGLPSFLPHLIWISWLETGLLCRIISFGYLPPQTRRLAICGMRQQRTLLRAYAWLLNRAVRMDKQYPDPAYGYAVVIRCPDSCQA